MSLVFGIFVVLIYLFLPLAVVWGWVRWMKSKRTQGIISYFALTGFALATASILLAISAVLYARHIGGFPYYDPRLLRIYRWGSLLSLTGFTFAVVGLWKPSPLRWFAPVCTLGSLVYWIGMAAAE